MIVITKKYRLVYPVVLIRGGVLCMLIESGVIPKELHLFYAHFKEHSDDTFQFVADLVRMARKYFIPLGCKVIITITKNSALDFFNEQKIIPHPRVSPCSQKLKIEPMAAYNFENGIQVDLVGYVKGETRRVNTNIKHTVPSLFIVKDFPISKFTDEWCIEICERMVGWVPKIYKIVDPVTGKRIFKHNNCLPCKNMGVDDLENVERYFPEKMQKAVELSNKLKAYWGRDADEFYLKFGRDDYHGSCSICHFD